MAGDRRANAQASTAPEHEELAVRDVDDAHDAEHQRQAERGQRQHRRHDQAFEGGEEEEGPKSKAFRTACVV